MFNKLKQFKDLRDQAKTLQSMLGQETITVERNGFKLVMNGNQEIVSLEAPTDATKQSIESTLPGLFNDAIKKIHRVIAEKMKQSGISLPGLQ